MPTLGDFIDAAAFGICAQHGLFPRRDIAQHAGRAFRDFAHADTICACFVDTRLDLRSIYAARWLSEVMIIRLIPPILLPLFDIFRCSATSMRDMLSSMLSAEKAIGDISIWFGAAYGISAYSDRYGARGYARYALVLQYARTCARSPVPDIFKMRDSFSATPLQGAPEI